MTLGSFFYRLIRTIYRKSQAKWDYLATKIIFVGQSVKFSNFRTRGIPLIDISRHGGLLVIGDNFAMNNGLSGNVIGYGVPCCISVADNCHVTIGRNVGMSQTTIIAHSNVTIMDNVKLGGGVKIYTSDFHSLHSSIRSTEDDIKSRICAPVTIGNDVFIGAGCLVLKGVSIGDCSIVGAGSVVTKSIPSNEIWAGNPAKFIRKI